MADFPDSTTAPEILRPVIESEIERLIAILDGMDVDPDLEETADDEPWLGAAEHINASSGWSLAVSDDCELDTSDDEPSCGAIEAQIPAPLTLFGGSMWSLFPNLRQPGPLTYSSDGFFGQDAAWGCSTTAAADECEPCCEDEGAQCDDEGAHWDDEYDYRDNPGDYGYPGALFGGIGYEPNRKPNVVATRRIEADTSCLEPLFGDA